MPFKTLMKPELAKLQIRNSFDVSSKVVMMVTSLFSWNCIVFFFFFFFFGTSVLQSRPESLTEAREVRIGGQTCTSQLKAALDNACLVFALEKRLAV